MHKIYLLLTGFFMTTAFSSCGEKVDPNQCFECITKITYSGSQYAPKPTSVTQKVCGATTKDALIRQNGTTTASSGGITISTTQTTGCRGL